ncbi:MAG: DNA translocase FtsK 4TM domain-containing protein [Candidatus Caldatribacteriota bacterium]|nr:DNA translocase FtsK 4TM domain-containing protein [Candidatus Caldatribacteriota bacterium]
MKRKKIKSNSKFISISILAFSLLYIFSFIFSNKMGIFSKIIVKTATQYIGIGSYFLPFLLLSMGLLLFFDYKLINPYRKFFAIGILFIIFLTFIHLKLLLIANSYILSKSGAGGGLIGYFLANSLFVYFGKKGAYLVLLSLSLISALFLSETSYFNIFNLLIIHIKKLINIIYSIIKKKSKKYTEKPEPINVTDYHEFETGKNDKKTIKKVAKKDAKMTQGEISFEKNSQEKEIAEYHVPPLSLLSESYKEDKTESKISIEQSIKTLENTFNNFGIDAKVIGVTKGPTVTRYEIQPAPGVKIAKITNLSNDIALAFAAASVRIEAPIPGKNAIGIEVPNISRTKVYLKEILESRELRDNKFKLPIALGIDIGGKPIITDLTELPHLLIAGTTGSGKSVCINNIILSIIYTLTPEKVKFIMLDPKRVELNVYNGIPHLLIPIITDTKQANKVLNWSISEMEKRFKMFAEAGVRNLEGYNEYIKNVKGDQLPLPYIIIIIDELADLMLSSPVKVEESLCRLAQMTRATGIHLIIATQRPSVDIITGSIKVNFPSRIAFSVSTQVDSRTILDVNGAEKLLGNGDMLFSPVGASKPIRAQGAFVKDKDIRKVIKFLEENSTSPSYNKEALEFKSIKNSSDKVQGGKEEEIDELFQQAVLVIINNRQASISILQRKLRIGYTRAARLIDSMEEKGIVGPYDGRNPRKILISKDEYLNKFEE